MSTSEFERRTAALRERMADAGLDLAVITDEDSIYYFSGYYHFLYMDFGRPSVLLVWRVERCALIVPSIELDMARRMSWVETIHAWQDGVGSEWRGPLEDALQQGRAGVVALEVDSTPPVVRQFIDGVLGHAGVPDLGAHVAALRMVKTGHEIDIARQTGQVAGALMAGAREAMADGVPEYEVALSAMAAGTRKAAQLLEARCEDPMMSPVMHFLQTMASGTNIVMPHHRASTRRLRNGEPLFMCFCGMASFRHFKLGFDRTFWIGESPSALHESLWETAVASQRAALDMIRPGVAAEEVHAAYADVIESAGHDFPFRCGRATGFSFLEKPELTVGDSTLLQAGMVFAIDGCVSAPQHGARAQIGDSIVVTDDGHEPLTHYSKALSDLVVT